MREKSELAVKFGEEVRQLRSNRKRSQEDFAEDCGIHRTYVGAIERGEKVVSLDMAKRVTAALGLTLSQFLARIGE
jgi:transcriptional regulator with XRE-family HTH domain